MFLLLLASCGSGEEAKTEITVEGVKFWSIENTQNIMRDDAAPEDATMELKLDCIKGETESIQLMIKPESDVSKYTVTVEDLKNKKADAVIPSSEIEIFAERYIETKNSSYTNPITTYMYPGWYPDALIPIDRSEKRRENNIKADNNQGIWFNVNVPSDAAAGEYVGNVIVTIDDQVQKIPMTLKVYDLTMPNEIHATSSFGVWYDYISYGEGDKVNDKTYENYYWFLANKRATPCELPTSGYTNLTEYADYLVDFVKNDIVSGYNLPYRSQRVNGVDLLDKQYQIDVLTAIINKNIELRKAGDAEINLLDKAYLYAWKITDEPQASQAQQIKDCDRIFTEAKKAVEPILADYPDLLKSLQNIRHVVTVIEYDTVFAGDETTGGVQTWCPQINEFGIEDFKQIMQDRRANSTRMNGEDFWWYNCISPGNPYPTYQIDDNLISSRIMRWMQHDFDVTGTLYWCVNFYYKCDDFEKGTYSVRDVWNDPASFETVNGDGQLVYPGSLYGLDTPISTLRLESIREGNEDYEYLWMFEQKINELNKKNNTTYNSDEILDCFYKQIFQGVIPKTDAATFKTVRTDVLTLLEKLYNDETEAIKDIDKLLQ